MEGTINPNANFHEDEDLMNGGQDIETMTPEALLNRPQTNSDAQQAQPQAQPQPAAQQPKKSNAPIIILIVILIAAVGIGILVFVTNAKKKKEAEANELAYRQQLEEESRRMESEMAALQTMETNATQPSQDIVDEEPIKVKASEFYTEEQMKGLIMAGFKPEEIDSLAEAQVPYENAMYDINKAIQSYYFNKQKEVTNNDDSLYKYTNFGQWKTDLKFGKDSVEKTYKDNVNFEKVPTYGLQVYLKLYLNPDNKNEFIIWNVDPVLYDSLKETGSLVIEYKYRFRENTDEGYYVYDIKLSDDDDITQGLKLSKLYDLGIYE